MSVKVSEAIGDEKGNARGGQPGDQTGNEILVRNFDRKRNYSFTSVLRCKNRYMAEKAADYAKRIALSPQFGYNQSDRWSGAKSIEAVGADNLEQAGAGDFDCSSLCVEAYRLAGCPVKMTGYTGSLVKVLTATGYFDDLTAEKYVDSSDYAKTGDIYVSPGHHALITITDGPKAESDPDPEPSVDYGNVVIIRGKVNVRRKPAGKVYMVSKQGDVFPYLGYGESDETGKLWWAVDCDHIVCFISSANPKHAILVED